MKKFILVIAAAVLSAGIMSAQTLAEATEIYNQGVESVQAGNNTAALELFQKALSAGETLGDEAVDLVANCKNVVPNVALAVAKDLVKESKYDESLVKFQAAKEIAEKLENAEVLEEIKTLLPQVLMQKGNDLLADAQKTADAEAKKNGLLAAGAAYKEAFAADPTNGKAALRLGQVLSMAGYSDEALDAFKSAAGAGEADAAGKQISNLYLKEAAAALKNQKYAEAVAAVERSEEYGVNPQAYMVAGQASQKLNKTNDAIKYFTKYLDAAPTAKNANAITFTVAALYQQAGNKVKALEFYQKIASDAKYGAQAKQMIDALKR